MSKNFEFLKTSVYLSGPISGCIFRQCTSWRNYVTKELEKSPYLFKCFSPLRGKEMLHKIGVIEDKSVQSGNFTGMDKLKTTDQFIMTRDFYDTINCDAVFVNLLRTTRVSIGTVMEIAWAFERRKPIILCMELENIHDHPMIRASSPYIVPDLDSGIALLGLIFAKGK